MKFLKKYKFNLLAFLLPSIILATTFIIKGVCTKNIFTLSDAHSQYLPTYRYLYNVLHGDATFPYTFTKGLGGTMYGAFFYGLSSPINLLIYFFKDIQLFMLLSTLLKISLSGFTMFLFLKKREKNAKLSLIFSLAYALSGYTILYYINIMWLDSVLLAPLILMGIDKIITQKKDFLYIITLFLSLVSNYYTGYILVLFSIIYFIYQSYIQYTGNTYWKDNWKNILHFLLITFLIGCLIMFILLPIFLESLNYTRVDINIKTINYNYLSLFAGTYIGFGNINNPINFYGLLIFCGTAILPLIIHYFTSKSISKKEKKASLIVLILFLAPVIIEPLSFIWHLFTHPQGFNYRYSFLTILFMLTLALKSIKNLDGSNSKLKIYYILYLIISVSLMYTAYKTPEYYFYLDIKKILLTLVLVLINCILISKKYKKAILGLLVIELITNITIIFYSSSFTPYKLVNQYTDYIEIEKEIYDNNYRFETTQPFSMNNSLYFNYNGSSTFLSSTNKYSLQFPYQLKSMDEKTNYFSYTNYNIISDMILGFKYVSDTNLNPDYDLIKTFDVNNRKVYFQKNDYALSLGFISSSDIKKLNANNFTEFEYLNDLLNAIDGQNNNYFIELEIETIDSKNYILKKDKQYSQIYIVSKKGPINIDNSKLSSGDNFGILYDDTNSDLLLEFDEDNIDIKAYALDINKIKYFMQNREQFNINKNDGNFISGTISSGTDGVFMTTIPYENGWEVYVDGKRTEYYKILESFIAFDLTKGNHTIELHYSIPGFDISIFVSLISLTILISYEVRKMYKTKNTN